MKKLILFLIFFLAFFSRSAFAVSGLKLSLGNPPSYLGRFDTRIYYTYLEVKGNTATVNLFIQKDGKDWKQTSDRDKTAVSGYFSVGGGDFYDGDGKYHLYAKAKTAEEEVTSATITLTVDNSAPGNVSDYRKERVNANDYRIYWKCPNDSDVEKTYIYRSKETSFTADSGTRIQEINCNSNESKIVTVVGDKDVDYYFALRAIDHAGNASGVVTDAPGEVIAGVVAGVKTESESRKEEPVSQLPEEENDSSTSTGKLAGGISSESGQVQGTEAANSSKKPYVLVGLGLGLLFLGFLYSRKREK